MFRSGSGNKSMYRWKNVWFQRALKYVKRLPSPWGIKIFALCGNSEILCNYFMYQGITSEYKTKVFRCIWWGSYYLFVWQSRRTKCHTVFFINFSNDYILLNLKYKNLCFLPACLDPISRPSFSPDKDLLKSGIGSSAEVVTGEVIITKLDSNVVHMVSNYRATGRADVYNRWDKIRNTYIIKYFKLIKNLIYIW